MGQNRAWGKQGMGQTGHGADRAEQGKVRAVRSTGGITVNKKIKMLAGTIILGGLTLGAFGTSTGIDAAYADTVRELPIVINGEEMPIESGALIINGVNMVPLRMLESICGYDLYWDADLLVATLIKGEDRITIPLGHDSATVNGKTVNMKHTARLIDNRLMVPLNFINDYSSLEVFWSPVNNKVNIYDPNVESKFGLEVQEKLNNRIITSMKGNKLENNYNSYTEMIIFDSEEAASMSEDYLEKAIAFSTILDRTYIVNNNEVREIELKEMKVGGIAINPAHVNYSVNNSTGINYKKELSNGGEMVIEELVDDSELVEKIIEKQVIESSEVSHLGTLEINEKNYNSENVKIKDASRWYNSIDSKYQTVIECYVDVNNMSTGNIGGNTNSGNIVEIYPLGCVSRIKDGYNNYLSLEYIVDERTNNLTNINYKGFYKCNLDTSYSSRMGLEKGKDYWVLVLSSIKGV